MKRVLRKALVIIICLLIGLIIFNQFVDRSIKTEVIINASPETVWSRFIDHGSYGEWNPFIKEISGPTEVGQYLKVFIQPKGQDGMSFEPEILVNATNKELRWVGKLGFKGVFDGEHYFILEPTENGGTKFIQGENFSGLLSGIFMGMIKESTEQGFKDMNQALKERVEQ